MAARLTIPAMYAALTAAGAAIAIPFPGTTVPFTLQVFFVLLTGALAGPAAGATSMIVYLALGLAGMPVFSMMTAGPGILLGPTGGYLAAFPAAALVVGAIAGPRKGAGTVRTIVAMLLGVALIHAAGISRLCWFTGKPLGSPAIAAVLPFIPLDAVKAVAAGIIASRARRLALPG
ncbi:MAG: biotin transporter BioY [Ignavibacteriales bacterium]